MPIALITGASRGLGRALALALAGRGWTLVVDGRGAAALGTVAQELRDGGAEAVHALTGDVTDREHLEAMVASAPTLDLLVANASTVGPSPMPVLADYPLEALRRVLEVNVVAPLALVQLALPKLNQGATVLMLSSDAAVEAYEGWGGYGASKAALDQLSAILAAEHPELHVHAVDPGDMRTRMHAEAFPGEDISDRPEPETVVPHLLALLDTRLPSGRRRAGDVEVAP
ncbi:MAG: SDR family oxidoreductase [Nocardioidaceae bacterium]|nr:SDR family oxidoreductase [Nocardioidaceae bacterium]